MDEILLTPEEIEREWWAAFDAWERECKRRETPPDFEARHSAYRAWCDDWLCRAQLAKVAKWMKAHTTQRLYVNAEFSNDEPMRVIMSGSDWQALREAAGGDR